MNPRFYKLSLLLSAAVLVVLVPVLISAARGTSGQLPTDNPSIASAASGTGSAPLTSSTSAESDIQESAHRVNQVFADTWKKAGIEPIGPADPMLVVRRLSLALCGTIPSLREIRDLETLPPDKQIDAHLDRLLGDRRFADYLAERLARAFVGTQDGPFLIYRRRRFVYWLSDQLAENRPYDDLVREIISAEGLWTDRPATNFITAFGTEQGLQKVPLAARTARAFLGLRIDCAECHDHPFAQWKQSDFEGLTAFFAPVENSLVGIKDKGGEYKVEDRKTKEQREVKPAVAFDAEQLAADGRRREQLAQWVTTAEGTTDQGTRFYFGEAIANRIWTLLFGRGIVEPVDDLEAEACIDGVLNVLADDFRSHGHDLRRLIRVIAATRAFRTAAASDSEVTEQHERLFAAFPLSRLRSEQIAGSLIQVQSLQTVDAESNVLVRFARVVNTADFINRYGDAGDGELNAHVGTIPQRLVMLNGKVPREHIEASPLKAAWHISKLAPTDQSAVRVAYLVTLTRPPTDDEQAYFVAALRGRKGKQRDSGVEDMLWALINSTEFSWNH